jgi:hypothetical protein
MKKVFVVFMFLSVNFVLQAQDYDYSLTKSWDEKPSLHTVEKPFDSSSAAGILDERRIEYLNDKDNNMFIDEYDHFIVKLMNDDGIENYNKVYIAMYANSEIVNIKARSISPDGRVIPVDNNNIKEIEEDNQKYKLFAFDGLEKGSEIEYAYTVKRNLTLFGSETFQRRNMPYLHAKFMLITPSYLKFDAKGYNGFNVSKDSVIDKQRIITGYSNNINEIDDEKYGETDPYLQRADYKISYNLDKNPNVRLYTWKEYAQKTYDYYTTRTSKEDKALDGFLSKIKLPQNASDAEKILAIEDYVKTNINIDKDLISEGADNIEIIVKKKASNEDGAVKLFTGIFDKLSINYQIVFPGTRTGYTIDEDLENWNRANNALIYFPGTGKYISPSTAELRYPFIPFEFAATRGLFLKGTVIGNFKTAIGSFGNIPIEPFEQNALNTEDDIKFNADLDTVFVKSKQIFKGYGAEGNRPIYNYLTTDKQAEANKQIIKSVTGSDDISNIKIENSAFTDYFDNKPLIISADIKSTELIERAGNKILFKLGVVIGPQEQMYQEKPRLLPVELPFPHMLNRQIILHIPEGYSVKNPDDINMDVEYKENGIVTMGFVSSYTKNDDTLTITIAETYREIKYPLTEFEDFKKVINASADFNKVVLVLQKK